MNIKKLFLIVIAAGIFFGALVAPSSRLLAQKKSAPAGLKVCADPSAPCQSPAKEFAPYELPFMLPRRLRANADYKSASFYAVMLKTFTYTENDECDQGEHSGFIEREREEAQQMFPDRKAFADHQCPDMGAVSYIIAGQSSESGPGPFLAVYAGETQADAEQTLRKAKSKYPAAVIKRMQVAYSRIVQ